MYLEEENKYLKKCLMRKSKSEDSSEDKLHKKKYEIEKLKKEYKAGKLKISSKDIAESILKEYKKGIKD